MSATGHVIRDTSRPGGRKTGAIVVGVSVLLFVAGALSLPRSTSADLESATAQNHKAATPAAPEAGSASPSPTATPTPSETGSPLDPETIAALAAGVGVAPPHAQPAYATKALDLLATLQVKGRAPKTGYDRALFGQAWLDVDRNGCDTRNDMLKRDLTEVTFTNSVPCKIQSGNLADPYTGTNIAFLRGTTTSTAVQIDHVVALSDAWQKGAQQLTTEQRTAFANDPLNLQSTDGPTNMKKGDGDAATWLPPNKGFRCEYVARQISVKATYTLWITRAEHDAMARILADCSGQLAPTSEKSPPANVPSEAVAQAPAPAPAAPAPVPVAPAPVPVPVAPVPAAVSYANCTAVRAAGAAPIYAGQPGYSRSLDRDGDGIACE
ncbi:hypothetical protein QFZ30_003140 [Arthrobacter pascens]|uniref:GmrSD restriction endonuclease domain-containing protein n=1 Tax=Arthrobacter pascens TaxID=1677 RepID=UPI002792CB79|nr:DUF1524 domain-containing protein [Arthrobacter pascens]MDQ0679758.1 hypothetical protein [Arthrobacter pascens]